MVIASVALVLALTASPAQADNAYDHSETFSVGVSPVAPFGECGVTDVDVDSQENVYVLCGGNPICNGACGTILKKFDKNGNPVAFTGSAPYIAGNTLIENPDPTGQTREGVGKTFSRGSLLAVDKSSGANAGFIYVTGTFSTTVISPDGRFAAKIDGGSVGTDLEGNVYSNLQWRMNKRDPAWVLTDQLYTGINGTSGTGAGEDDIAVDSTGAVWGIGRAVKGDPFESVSRFEADQFGPAEQESTFSFGNHAIAKPSPLLESPLKEFGSTSAFLAKSIAVDPSDDSLYAQRTSGDSVDEILHFSRGDSEEKSHQLSGPIGDPSTMGGTFEMNKGMAIGPTGTIYAAKENGISVFTKGGALPTVRDHVADVADVGHTSAQVGAELEVDGGSPITSCEVRYGLTQAYGNTAPCTPDPDASAPGSNFGTDTEVTADISGLLTGSTYHFAFVASNADGTAYGINRTVRPTAVIGMETESPTDITDHSATLNGSLDPDGMTTSYRFEYGLAGDFTESTPDESLAGSGDTPVSLPVENLKAGAEYSFRLVATNELGTTMGQVQKLLVAGPPVVSGVRATGVNATEADLNARINPGGYATTYKFEYGIGPDYGSTVPLPPVEGDAGEASTGEVFTNHVTNLREGVVYHFRVVATNEWGTATSNDTTFNFFPQPCPNEHVRQVTKSSYLPDCRAYEIVSPENAGGAQIYPGDEIYSASFIGIPQFKGALGGQREIQNTGLATNPSRFMFYAGLGSIPGLDAPNANLDAYTSTRTNDGWKTTFSGIQGTETGGSGRKTCSIELDLCIDHWFGDFENSTQFPENWAYLYDLSGRKIGILPSNVRSVPGGEDFIGDWRTSGDLSHFAFSSRDVVFAPGGTTEDPGSAYDNDVRNKTVTLISKLPNGESIGSGVVNPKEFINLPPTSVSQDGSHILMTTQASDGPTRLFMRVDGAITYEVSAGAGVELIGASADGTRVLFSTNQQLAPEDEDHGTDIYAWSENGGNPTLTVVTQGNGQGNADDCNATWTSGCSVGLVRTERGDRSGFSTQNYSTVALSGIDSKLASESGGVLFFSPETLDGAAPRNGKNLYLANDGQVHYIGTLGSTQSLSRVQLSPDGLHVGFLTEARLSSYDNAGFKMMYAYNARTERLDCASCLPSGLPPTVNVEASQNGPFMSDDGRVFFATGDQLVAADVDTLHLPDVYEYTEGRPQLISSGTSSNAKAPGGATVFLTLTIGLEAVSADGRDVFFSTTDSMVPQDQNGKFVKIYDARANGGFEPPPELAPCVAADECHGPGAAAPDPLQIGTGSSVNGGNVTPAKKKARKGKSAKKKGKKSKRHSCKRSKKKSCARKAGGNR